MTDTYCCRKDAFYGAHQNQKAMLSQGEPRDAAIFTTTSCGFPAIARLLFAMLFLSESTVEIARRVVLMTERLRLSSVRDSVSVSERKILFVDAVRSVFCFHCDNIVSLVTRCSRSNAAYFWRPPARSSGNALLDGEPT